MAGSHFYFCFSPFFSGRLCHGIIRPARLFPFDFARDTFSFTNRVACEYRQDEQGRWLAHRDKPRPLYCQHCFVVARSARQFFIAARFDPQQPIADDQTYRRLVHRVVATNPRYPLPDAEKIIIPGFAGLRQFSAARSSLLQEECGGAWQSYVQRGHWRMIFPFTRHEQTKMAEQLVREINGQHAVVSPSGKISPHHDQPCLSLFWGGRKCP